MGQTAEQLMSVLGAAAKAASHCMCMATTADKNRALMLAAQGLRQQQVALMVANDQDLQAAKAAGLSEAMLDRLRLNEARIEAMAEGLEQVAALPDPVAEISDLAYRPSGIQVGKMRTPLGVIGIVYESRPNVTADAAALCLKSGNAAVLRGGSEAFHSNQAIASILRTALQEAGLPVDALQLIASTDRALVGAMLRRQSMIDVIIPRGGRSLIERVSAEAEIPVIKHLDGVCHVYVDAAADLSMASAIAVNAKTQRPGVCNALETLLVHADIAEAFLPRLVADMQAKGVSLFACERTRAIVSGLQAATEHDWNAEYLSLQLAVRIVDDLSAAMSHIEQYGSGHTESIITENYTTGQQFLRQVDASSVMWNASTRFADGFEYGLGAEIGISTDRLHAHINHAFQAKPRTNRRGGNPVLTSAGLGNNPAFSHPARQQNLPQHVVDFMRTRMVQLVALEVDFCAAKPLCQTLGKIKRAGAANVMFPQIIHLGPEFRVGFGLLVFGLKI